ncbi:hypothetical protein [Sphingomonas xinjiangensis]|uniref:Uncharacterized protein n=1 Tax=Sphingomonas xinjiangensis TaxID=643568 RepID=A0A840YRV1_9SPHN|nr:hypothetical protein [Sphingomonas xinjiangensis]MBB5712407.1 hypothetical protein [Sphingomonas xinjiangensis]
MSDSQRRFANLTHDDVQAVTAQAQQTIAAMNATANQGATTDAS